MSNVFVVSSVPIDSTRCKAVLGFRNVLGAGTVTPSSEDAAYPKSLMTDYKTNTEYSPAITSGSVIIYFQQPFSFISYFGLLSKNAFDCGLSFTVETLDYGTIGTYTTQGTRSGFANGVPQMLYFEPVQTTTVRLTINFTSKCYIASVMAGEAIAFTRTVSVGYQPARFSSLDEVEGFTTLGNNFVAGRRLLNGFEERATVSFQRFDEIETWWASFMNHVLDSKPLFFMANDQNSKCVYGLQVPDRLEKPTYKTSHLSDLQFEIRGFA